MNNKTSKNNWHYGMVIISFAIGIYIASTTILILTGLLLWKAAIISGVVVNAALFLREFSVIAGRDFLCIEPCDEPSKSTDFNTTNTISPKTELTNSAIKKTSKQNLEASQGMTVETTQIDLTNS